jgi:tripartite-type tricarboxylate transporter receptor subunit TctC
MFTRSRSIVVLVLAWCLAGGVAAQAYPTKPVRVVVPFPPGGPSDVMMRVIAQKLGESLGQPFLVENRAGGGANIGAEYVARAAPDGYTLGLLSTGHAVNMTLYEKLAYDTLRDFAPISLLLTNPLVLVTQPGAPIRSVAELIRDAKAKPGELTYGSTSIGASTHLAAELFNVMAGVKLTHIPYKGSAPALADVMAGRITVLFDTTTSAMSHVRSGKLRALAVTSKERSPAAPELPTVAETLAGFEAIGWNGLAAPSATPRAIVDQLNRELSKVLPSPEVKDKLAASGSDAAYMTPDAFGAFLRAEIEKWGRIVKLSGAKAD